MQDNISATSDLLRWQNVDRLGCYTNKNTSYKKTKTNNNKKKITPKYHTKF